MTEPDYYAKNGLSPLMAYKQGLLSKDQYIGFLKGNVIKYTVRCESKGNPVQDVDKAIDYLQHLRDVMVEEAKK